MTQDYRAFIATAAAFDNLGIITLNILSRIPIKFKNKTHNNIKSVIYSNPKSEHCSKTRSIFVSTKD